MHRLKPTIQKFEDYTKEDFAVWQQLYIRQMQLLSEYASKSYLDAVDQIGFKENAIPDFGKTTQKLISATGWELTVVPELVPQQHFFELLSNRVFPATCWLRTAKELDYIEEPDMFHDVFGHVPLLVNPAYALFMQGFGELAMKWADVPEAIKLLSRVYWFTIEFGLISETGSTKIYGAGILSSPGETVHSMHPETVRKAFHIETILTTAYRTDILQEHYFVIHSFEQLYESLPAIDNALQCLVSVQTM
jgi:phenylalanine-4-hydroxylase